MEIVFQVGVIIVTLLIAYWWANQGILSAFLHFLCVLVAGAITFAAWEPLVGNLLLRNGGFDNYAWGTGFLVLFVGSLVVLRFATDRLVPNNVDLSQTVNLIGGGVIGAAAAIITAGMLVIGIGMIQSSDDIMGFRGWTRTASPPYVQTTDQGAAKASLWFPVHTMTVRTYEFLSKTSFYPNLSNAPLAAAYPHLDKQALSLFRSAYRDGTGRTTIPPDGARVTRVFQVDSGRDARFVVGVQFNNSAFDRSEQLIVTNAQVRLLAYPRGDLQSGRTSVGHPDRWSQPVASGGGAAGGQLPSRSFLFDDIYHYITSVTGQQSVEVFIEFPIGQADYGRIRQGDIPRFIQIKGTRFALPSVRDETNWVVLPDETALYTMRAMGYRTEQRAVVEADPNAPMARPADIFVQPHIRPLNLTFNQLRTITHENRWLVRGFQTFTKGLRAGTMDTRIHGIHSPDGASIVQVDVSRSAVTNIYGVIAENFDTSFDAPMLVDAQGRTYFPMGYFYETPDQVTISLTPDNLIQSVRTLPQLPSADTHRLRLYFYVTNGVTLTSFRVGEFTIARTSLTVQ